MSLPKRKTPAKGVLADERLPTIVFLTVCTAARRCWLASRSVHSALVEIWISASAWEVGSYILMPNHLHLFASPTDSPINFDSWVRYWKSIFSKELCNPALRWQSGCFHHRLRCCESAEEKRRYMDLNPVRAGLVKQPDEWPFRGQIFESEHWW